jgi:predicted amidohydrolase YtcJ
MGMWLILPHDTAGAGFDDQNRGVLSADRLADFAPLDRNIFDMTAVESGDTRVTLTVVGGRKAFERSAGQT